ncbi:asparaginase [Halocynthiibacter sp.]|uniref:asparaginase n=1 Tax=Halocynthiibacter sp. TaxID=1979210 RepID=UPI003C63238A
MTAPATLTEIWRGDILESIHTGHVVISDHKGQILESWGNPDHITYPRSSCKMIQALPLVESGAADAYGLTPEHLALACASHQGAFIHTDRVGKWLSALDLGESDLRCGPQEPNDLPARNALIKTDDSPCQFHNNCSGKHSGFLTWNKHMGHGADYHDPTHPLQIAIKEAFEDTTGETSPGYGIDGCSAPNYATSVAGLARAMGFFAGASENGSAREKAAVRLRQAMALHPDLVAGETRACTELMRATDGKVSIKTGADGVFIAIIPEKKIGVALKISDGATRASECTVAAILVKLGVLDPNHPATKKRLNAPILNWNKVNCGTIKAADSLK